jgi:TPR repeat protein
MANMTKTNAGITMKELRLLAGALAASAILALPAAHAAPVEDRQPNVVGGSPPAGVATPNQGEFDMLLRAVEAGNAEAMNILGVAYVVGTQVPRDYSRALYWFQKAADAGSSTAMNNLATVYLFGLGVPCNSANAFRWLERSAANGNVRSMYSVAVMADEGFGTSRDPRLARAMFRKAAESGYAPAMVRVSDDYARGSGVGLELVEAYAWLQVALAANTSEDLQISVLSRMERLEARLAPTRRDAARVRAAQLVATMKGPPLPDRHEGPVNRRDMII